MRKIESDYLDEYKSLDKIFCDAFECKNGVSEYISRMEAASETYASLVDGWKDDYKLLKHLRWLRNKISHEAGDTECEKQDLEDLREFKKRVSRSKDPLAQIAKVRKAVAAQKKGGRAAADVSGKDGFGLGKALLWVALIAVLMFAVYRFFA